jgi:sulfoxide reductase heme-binding subunit YedZ
VTKSTAVKWIAKPLAFAAGLGPVAYLTWAVFTNHLSPNPVSDVTNLTGVWTLRFVCITLAITPVRKIFGWHVLTRFRRMTGLFAFFYGSLHFLTYAILDRFLGLELVLDRLGGVAPGSIFAPDVFRGLAMSVGADVLKRPFITVGFTAFVLMIPLAITSTAGWIRRLGGRRWNLLHRLIYVTGIAAVVHYWWLVKADVSRPQAYAFVVALLLGARLYLRYRKAAATSRVAARTTSSTAS